MFWHDGRASEAKSKIDYNAPHSWHGAVDGLQYVYVDETSHGGTAHWQINNFQLQEGSFSDRYHLRIFNGGNSNHDSFKYWAIGAVHKEILEDFDHVLVPDAWEISESHLKSDLSSTTGILSVGTINLANSGYYEGM